MAAESTRAEKVQTLIVQVGLAFVWRIPMAIARACARALYDYTLPALLGVAVLLGPALATGLCWVGVERELWGQDVAQVWRTQAQAREALVTVKARLDQHNRAPRGVDQSYVEWAREGERLREAIKGLSAYAPSPWLPLAPAHRFEPGREAWSWFYQAQHFYFGSIYGALGAAYLALGLVTSWKGSARWRRRRWAVAERQAGPGRLLLGLDDAGKGHYLTAAQRVRHAFIAGTTGSGKTETLKRLTRDDVESKRGLVFIDMKGDRGLAEWLFATCAAAGRAEDFRFFSMEAGEAWDAGEPGSPGFSHSYAALAQGDTLAKRDRLMCAGSWTDEAFYRNECRAALGRILKVLAPRGALTFEDICLALDDKDAYALVREWASPNERGGFDRDLEDWALFRRNTSGLRANLEEFVQLGTRLCAPHGDIDFREVHAGNRIVYFELNSQMRKEAASALARLILEDLKCLSGSLAAGDAAARKPFSVYIDEASNAVYDGFAGFISQCRSAGIGLVLASQSPLDFDGILSGVGLTVAQNTATKLLFCQRDPESASACAELGGTRNTIKRTSQMVDDGLFPVTSTGVHSEREVKEFHAHPDELKSLSVGRAFLIQDETRALIETKLSKPPPPVPFAPVVKVPHEGGAKQRLPALSLGARVKEWLAQKLRDNPFKAQMRSEDRPGDGELRVKR